MNASGLSVLLTKRTGIFNIRRGFLNRYLSTINQSLHKNVEDKSGDKAEQMTKKLRAKTPIGKLDELDVGKHPYQEKEPLKEWPNNTNPITGEVGGPRGPEPTRYGDWERKGRVTDF